MIVLTPLLESLNLMTNMFEVFLKAINNTPHIMKNPLTLFNVRVELECLLVEGHEVSHAIVLQLRQLLLNLLSVSSDIKRVSVTIRFESRGGSYEFI